MTTPTMTTTGEIKTYTYRTDCELGTIEAESFADACAQLDALVPQAAIEDGGWGWVRDLDGRLYEVGNR